MKNIIVFILVVLLYSCSSSTIKDVDYKSFSSGDIWICTMPEKNLDEIEGNGKSLANPMSNIVALFYFKDGQTLPSLSNMSDFNSAREHIISLSPIASYYKYPNGKTAVIDLEITNDATERTKRGSHTGLG